MIFETKQPETLKPFIRDIVYHKGYQPTHSKDRFLPDGTVNLVFDFLESPKYIFDNNSLKKKQECRLAWFSGMQSRYLTISSGKDAEMMVVSFKAGGAYPFLERSLYLYNDCVVPADEVFGEKIFEIRNKMIAEKSHERKFELIEDWLLSNKKEITFTKEVISPLVALIENTPEKIQINEVVKKSGYSQKQCIHLFKKHIGLSPKQFHKIIRFNEILNTIHGEKQIEWAKIAAGCGYFDQAHFIKDFQVFSGLNPKKYITDQGDYQHYVPLR